MSIVGFILMVAAGCGAVVGMRMSKKGNKQGMMVAAPCAILAVVLAVGGLLISGNSTPKLAKALNRYSYACGQTLGKHLVEHHSGSRLLLLVEPTFGGDESDILQVAIEEGLKASIGSDLIWAGTVPVDPPPAYVERAKKFSQQGPPPYPENPIPYEMRGYEGWFSSGYLAKLLAEHEGTYDVLVSAVGLPRNFPRSRLVKNGDLPETIAVLNAHGMPMRGLVKSGIIDTVVAVKPSVNPWKDVSSAPHDLDEAFAKRFILVTQENLDEMVAAYPKAPNLR